MSGNSVIRVLVVDDHPIVREGIASLLEVQPDMVMVGEAGDGGEAVELFRKLQPDVTLMDIQMPGINGNQAIAMIRAEAPQAVILVLSTYADEARAARALKAGASGYVVKSALRKELVEIIRSVHGGERHLDADIATRMAFPSGENVVSNREADVLRLIALGHSNRETGLQLGISEETVKTHLKGVFGKLRVTDRTHAVIEAIRRGIIEV